MNKTAQVKQALLNEVRYGILVQGGRLPTERALQERFGLSRVTVRRALAELRQENAVGRKPGKKGLFVQAGLPVKRRVHRNIGLLMHFPLEEQHPFMHRFLIAAANACAKANFSHQIFSLHQDTEREEDEIAAVMRLFAENRVDGFLIHCPLADETVDHLQGRQVPAVLINAFVPGVKMPCVYLAQHALDKVTRHLYALGHRRIGFLTGPQQVRVVHEGILDFQRSCKALSLPCEHSLIWEGAYNEERVERGLRHFLGLKPRPSALIVEDDLMAGQVMNRCQSLGIRIPKDLAIVGIGGVALGEFFHPPLTTLWLAIEDAARAGVQMLLQLIHKQPCAETFVALDSKLVVRKSCGAKGPSTGRTDRLAQ